MFKFIRLLCSPLRKIINVLQNVLIKYFEPMSLGPVGTQSWRDLIKNLIEKDSHIIDFGCGTGSFSYLFNHNRYLGVDINNRFIDIAKKRYPEYTFITNLDTFKKNLNFDYILFNGVLHHINDHNFKEIISNLKYFVKANCELIIIEPISPENIFSIEFMIKSLDLGDYIRKYNQYKDLVSNNLSIVEHFEKKIGWNNLIIIKAKFK